MGSRKLDYDYLVEEVEWLLANGMSPYAIPGAMNRTPGALYKAFWRHGRPDLSKLFDFDKVAA